MKGLCEYLDLRPQQIYWLVFKRQIPFTKLNGARNGKLRFNLDEIEKWLAEKSVNFKDVKKIQENV